MRTLDVGGRLDCFALYRDDGRSGDDGVRESDMIYETLPLLYLVHST